MNNTMKILLTLLVLLFSSSVLAEDVSDFEIEGMSIGDSLLDYFSKTEIENLRNYDDLPSSMKFRITWFESNEFNMNLYEGMQIYHKPEDNNFIIHGLNGYVYCYNNNECEKLFNNILNEMSIFFKNVEKTGGDTLVHPDDKSGKSTATNYYFELINGWATVQYRNWSSEVQWQSSVVIEIFTNEVDEWIVNNYF